MSENKTPPKPKDYWINRRVMGWSAFAGLFIFGLIAVFTDKLANLSLVESIVWIMGLIVMTYMGGASLVDVAAKFKR